MAARAKEKAPPQDGASVGRYGDFLAAELPLCTFSTKGDRTKYRLKIAAAQALEEIGYQDIKVSDICGYAKVALGTFYVYYRDKNEIAIEIVLEFVEHLYDRAREVGRGTGDYEAILNTNRFFVAAYSANPGLMQCHVQLNSQVPEFREVWRPRHLKWIEGLARSISRRGNYDESLPGSPQAVAHALEGMVFHYLYAVIVTGNALIEEEGPDHADDLAQMLSTLWYRAVYGRDPGKA